jgi:hypothetical protein
MEQNGTKSQTRGGNTKTPRVKKYRRYCFTLNNYGTEDIKVLETFFSQGKYIFGEEIGPLCGTPHLQGYVEYKNPVSFQKMKEVNKKIHIEPAKGDRYSNIKYCGKDKKYFTNFLDDEMKRPIDPEEEELAILEEILSKPFTWQQDILNLIKEEPDRRTIHWFWEPSGNSGKSTLCKYLGMKYNALSIPSKAQDAYHQIIKAKEEKRLPKIIIIDVPRSSLDFINYQAIENIKNGFVTCGKYEGGTAYFKPPHVIIFANEEPIKEKMSSDRWHIERIVPICLIDE